MRRPGALLTALLVGLWAVPAAAEPPIWRVKGRNAEVVLFGSVHVLTDGVAWRSPALEKELAEANEIWFEIPNSPQARAQGSVAAQQRGRLPKGQRLSNLLTPEGRRLLARALERLRLPDSEIEGLRPWFAEAVLSLTDLSRRGARQAEGVEEQVAVSAPPAARVRSFETPAEQIGFLAGQSTRDQVKSLIQTLKDMETDPEAFNDLQKAWVSGDVGWLEREALAPMRKETPRLYQSLVVDRNRRWTDQIERMLEGSDEVFVVVGVGHLVGPESVPAMLRKRGHVVEGP